MPPCTRLASDLFAVVVVGEEVSVVSEEDVPETVGCAVPVAEVPVAEEELLDTVLATKGARTVSFALIVFEPTWVVPEMSM